MTLHPEVAEKARQELDAVVGNDRLPSFEDKLSLPYLDALIKEIFRWHSITPLCEQRPLVIASQGLSFAPAAPHTLMQDDIYEGYHIPKGRSTLLNNCSPC
jgi:hypothetical protein